MVAQHLANNLPQMTASTYVSNVFDGMGTAIGVPNNLGWQQQKLNENIVVEALRAQQELKQQAKPQVVKLPKEKPVGRRIIKVIIIDPDEKVPLEKCVLYSGEEKLTDLNDQELFFEIDIKNKLDAHNEERKKLIDKSVKERKEHLEPIKIRDLRMVVVTVASF